MEGRAAVVQSKGGRCSMDTIGFSQLDAPQVLSYSIASVPA